VAFTLEVDVKGDGHWAPLREVEVAAKSSRYVEFTASDAGVWLRLRANHDCQQATAYLHSHNDDTRATNSSSIFDGIARPDDKQVSGGLLRARGENLRTLAFAATDTYYELDGDLKLRRKEDTKAADFVRKNMVIPKNVISVDAASVLYVDDKGKRWRLPKGDAAFDAPGVLGDERVDREVATERDLFNCHGTFYELPAESSGGFAKVRPITTHNRRIKDYATYRGMLVFSGITNEAKGDHIVRSDDGKVALWAGALDDIWQLGKPRGTGGPWKNAVVKAGEPSDPYLATGYDKKRVTISNEGTDVATFHIEADATGTGQWMQAATLTVKPGEQVEHRFSEAFGAYWLRVVADHDTTATAMFVYE
jgi:hypothetical protein